MAARFEWIEDSKDTTSPVLGEVVVHQGLLFFNKERKCNLRKELAGPPGRGEHGEVQLRLVGGRWGSLKFEKNSEADALERTCKSFWKRAAKSGAGLAPAVFRLLQAAADGADARERSRSRSRNNSPPRSKRLLRRLSSVEVEGMWRLQRVQDLQAERANCQKLQQHQIVEECRRRKMMTREELMESLRKEAELQRKIQAAEREAEEERQRFEDLRSEEENIFESLQASDQKLQHEHVIDDPTSLYAEPSEIAKEGESRPFLCAICHDAERCVVFLPCKHLVCCAECGHGAQRLPQCPMCRTNVVWRFKVFV